MRVTYDPEIDAAYIRLPAGKGPNVSHSISVPAFGAVPQGAVVLDIDLEGKLVGIEIWDASRLLPTSVLASAERTPKVPTTFDVSAPNLIDYVKWVPAPIPDPRDPAVATFVSELCVGGPSAVAVAIASASDLGRDVLVGFAERMASAAVRRDDRELLIQCLVALFVGGLTFGGREALMVMSLIDDAARRIDVDLMLLIRDAEKIVGEPGAIPFVQWLMRAPGDRTLDAMHFVAGEDEGGFRYLPRRNAPTA